MHTTTRLGLDVLDGTDGVNTTPTVDAQAKGVLDTAVLVTEGTLVSRPAANTVEKDHVYKATDTLQWFISDGANWNTMLVAGAWSALTLGTNISAVTGPTPSARLEGDYIRLKGAITATANLGSGATLFTVPSLAIPTTNTYVNAVVEYGSATASVPFPLLINHTGGTVVDANTADGSKFTSGGIMPLESITYCLS